MVLERWREVTGETKVKASDGRVVLMGDRSGTWLDDAEQSEFAGLETPFAVIHKATQHTVYLERQRDATRGTRARRTAAQLFQKVSQIVQRIVTVLWEEARAQKLHAGNLHAVTAFRRKWEAPGFVKFARVDGGPTVVFFMRKETRDRWKGRRLDANARRYRAQQYCPPQRLPARAVSIFTDGSAVPRKPGEHHPPAGCAAVMVVGGDGPEHRGGEIAMIRSEQVTARTKNVKNATNNAAELMGFTRALQEAARHRWLRGRPVCMRYDSAYAAMIASGTWRARKHKDAAEEARRAWSHLRHALGGQLWMRHVKGHSNHEWNDWADKVAGEARLGMVTNIDDATVMRRAPP